MINIIGREELKEKLNRGDDFKLVMTLSEWAFEAQHIPGSINVTRPADAAKYLDRDDEIVVYCSNEKCIASQVAYQNLVGNGYKNVRRYAGGLVDWEEAGYALDGTGIF
jgi:rhodanese-related sulfurtransferase